MHLLSVWPRLWYIATFISLSTTFSGFAHALVADGGSDTATLSETAQSWQTPQLETAIGRIVPVFDDLDDGTFGRVWFSDDAALAASARQFVVWANTALAADWPQNASDGTSWDFCRHGKLAWGVQVHQRLLKQSPNLYSYLRNLADTKKALAHHWAVAHETALADIQQAEATGIKAEIIWRSTLERFAQEITLFGFEHEYEKILSENAWFFLRPYSEVIYCHLIADNEQWLKKYVAEHGWPTFSKDGVDISNRMVTLAFKVQDIEFQKTILKLLQKKCGAQGGR